VGSNDSPVAIAGSGSSITEDSPDNITLSAADIDIGDSLSYTLVSQPSYGTVSISGNQVLFAPDDNLSAISYTDSFVFRVTDSQGAIDTATVSLTVSGANDPPTANPLTEMVMEDAPRTIALSATDPDMDDSLTYSLLTNSQYGTLSNFNSTTGTFTFFPNDSLAHNLSYTETLNYRVSDNAPTGSATATSTITLALTGVNDAPVANANDYTNNPSLYVQYDQQPSLTLTGSDVDGDSFTYHLADPQPQYTEISNFNSLTGTLTLSMKNDVSCSDSIKEELNFYVRDSQGAVSNTAAVEFRVTGPLAKTSRADLFVAKYDSEGNQLWSRQLGTPMADVGVAVISDYRGNIYLAGVTQGVLHGDFSAGGWDVFLIKFDDLGQELWSRQFGSAGDEAVVAITADEEGNVYLTGQTSGNLAGFVNAGGKDLFVIKYDPQGNQEWMHQWGTTEDEVGTEVSVDALGNLNLLGQMTAEAETTQPKHFYSRYDRRNGRLSWFRYLDTSQVAGQALTLDYTGNVFLAGSKVSSNLEGSSTSIFEYQPALYQ
jgi:VCBS repeat-containing protein